MPEKKKTAPTERAEKPTFEQRAQEKRRIAYVRVADRFADTLETLKSHVAALEHIIQTGDTKDLDVLDKHGRIAFERAAVGPACLPLLRRTLRAYDSRSRDEVRAEDATAQAEADAKAKAVADAKAALEARRVAAKRMRDDIRALNEEE